MSKAKLMSALEALLFISGEPLSFTRLAKITDTDVEEVTSHMQALSEKYMHDEACGLMIIIKDGKAVLATKPENTLFIEALAKGSLQENLSKAALEVLAIIAYRSPITRAEIEAIRGVNCSFTLRNLLLRDLIERQENPEDAREYVYLPTFRFLQSLGLQGTKDLPEYSALSQDERLKMIVEEDGHEPEAESKEETKK
jgi:segregation and condensation protein B